MRAELHWITDAPVGRLAIMPRPRADDWLVDELSSWKSAGVDVVVSLLTDDEISELGLQKEPALSDEFGLTFHSYPIADRNVPCSVDGFLRFVDQLYSYLQNDHGVAVHCRMGIGRSSLVAACLLVKSGLAASEAYNTISRARGINVPDTKAQIEWVESIASHLGMDDRNGTNS